MSETLTRLADGFVFLEGPRWHEGRLWVSDMHGERVLAIGLDGAVEEIATLPTHPSGLGWLPDGRLLVVSMEDRTLRRLEGRELVVHARLDGLATWYCNDMVVDAAGRAYVGNFGWDYEQGGAPVPATLALVHPDGRVEAAASDLLFPNGTILSADGRTMIIAETFGQRLTAFDVGANGALSNRRVWAQLDGVFPDGICGDAEGAVWVASPMTSECVRVVAGGAVTTRIPTGQPAIACALGGADRQTLFVCSSAAIPKEQARRQRGSRVDTLRVEVPGAGMP